MAGSGQKVIVVPVRPRGRPSGYFQLSGWLSAVAELHHVVVAVQVDLEKEPGGQGVDHRDAHAVQPARDLVATALAELSAGVEGGHHHFGGGLPLVLGHRPDRNPSTVVDHPHTTIGEQRDVDLRAEPGHRLVHRIVHHLPHQVVQAGRAGRSDVHPGALAHRVETFQNGDVLGAVRGGSGVAIFLGFQRHRRALSNIG